MVHFQYKTVAPDGTIAHGQLEAPDRDAAAARLQSQGHLPLTLQIAQPKSGLRALLSQEIGKRRIGGTKLVADLIGRVALLLEAGVALEVTLALLATSEGTSAVRDTAGNLLRKLRGGSNLADAMASLEGVFPPIVIAMVRAGQTSGALAPTLGRLADHLARAEAVRESIRSALIYPAVLLVTAAGSVLLVLLVVLPQLEPVLVEAGDRLPLLTRMAFAASSFFRHYWLLLFAFIGAVSVGCRQLLRDPVFAAHLDAVILRLPILGLTVRRAEAARFARVLGTLLGGGLTLVNSLALSKPVLANRFVADAIEKLILAVREGGGIAGPLARVDVFPDLAVQMIRIGEATGRLDAMLLRLADLLDSEVQQTINRALSLLVPALTIGIGALVAGIIASVMLAVLGINDLLH
jgi:general secretion pathway protein F